MGVLPNLPLRYGPRMKDRMYQRLCKEAEADGSILALDRVVM
jgi:hypothetical protein